MEVFLWLENFVQINCPHGRRIELEFARLDQRSASGLAYQSCLISQFFDEQRVEREIRMFEVESLQ